MFHNNLQEAEDGVHQTLFDYLVEISNDRSHTTLDDEVSYNLAKLIFQVCKRNDKLSVVVNLGH